VRVDVGSESVRRTEVDCVSSSSSPVSRVSIQRSEITNLLGEIALGGVDVGVDSNARIVGPCGLGDGSAANATLVGLTLLITVVHTDSLGVSLLGRTSCAPRQTVLVLSSVGRSSSVQISAETVLGVVVGGSNSSNGPVRTSSIQRGDDVGSSSETATTEINVLPQVTLSVVSVPGSTSFSAASRELGVATILLCHRLLLISICAPRDLILESVSPCVRGSDVNTESLARHLVVRVGTSCCPVR